MILSRRPDIERFLGHPDPNVRAALIYGRDRQVVRDRAVALAAKVVPRPDDPFDVTRLNDGDLDGDGGRLEGELTALSMMGGRRLVWLRLAAEKGPLDRQASDILASHVAGNLNPDCFFLIEGGNLGRESLLRKGAEKAPGAAVIPCYEDEAGDTVRLVQAPAQGVEVTGAPAEITGTVLNVTAGDTETVVDVLVADNRAGELAARAASGDLALVLASRER